MIQVFRNLHQHHELIAVLAWKTIALRYKQAYFGVAWVVLKPLVLLLMFMLIRSFVGIDSGDIPYPLLTYCALVPWIFFQESTSDGVVSVVQHASLIRKVYLPREIFPIAAVVTKLLELGIGLVILGGMMAWFGFGLRATVVWVPVLIFISVLAALTISFIGAALNVHFRDIGQMVPLGLSIMMYASPVIYPLALVKEKLLVEQAAGEWSRVLFNLYSLNPLVGVIDGFQRVLLLGVPPDLVTLAPSLVLIALGLPLSYLVFKRAEAYFADVV